MSENPDAHVQRLFKTVARMARFHRDEERGLAAGIERALELMPFFPDYYRRVHGLPCTNRILLNLAGTRTTTLTRYRTGEGLSEDRQAMRSLAIQILDSGVVLVEDDVRDLCRQTV